LAQATVSVKITFAASDGNDAKQINDRISELRQRIGEIQEAHKKEIDGLKSEIAELRQGKIAAEEQQRQPEPALPLQELSRPLKGHVS
jgi:gas vesicle protein